MSHGPISLDALTQRLQHLLTPGLLGNYNCCEVTEVVGFHATNPKKAINVLSSIVLEERVQLVTQPAEWINNKPLRIAALKDWSFGIYRYTLTPADLLACLMQYAVSKIWRLSGNDLHTSTLTPTRFQFTPPDSSVIESENPSLNKVLKNNFWSGAHVCELFDQKKELLKPLLELPSRIQDLSEKIHQFVPLQLASITDRLGNIIIQLPVTVLKCQFGFDGDTGVTAKLAWNPPTANRQCRLVAMMEYDGALPGFATIPVFGSAVKVPTGDSSQSNCIVLWDDENQLVIAACREV